LKPFNKIQKKYQRLFQKNLPNSTNPYITYVIVSLCDHNYQRIIIIFEKIGNGQDARNNVYQRYLSSIKHISESSKTINFGKQKNNQWHQKYGIDTTLGLLINI
jgi:hypothetical protein